MKIRHNRRGMHSLAAGIPTREQRCAYMQPGSAGWATWGCGPAPAPAPTPSYAPTPAPTPSYAPAPAAQAPAPIDYDAELARQLQARENAFVSAQLQADEQSKIAAAQAAKAAAAEADAAAMRAAADASMQSLDVGGGGYSTYSADSSAGEAPDSGKSSMGWLAVVAAFGAIALLSRRR